MIIQNTTLWNTTLRSFTSSVGVAPSFIASSGTLASSTTTCTLSSFTIAAGAVAVLFSGAEKPSQTISTITGTNGLTWTKRATYTASSGGYSNSSQAQEIWYAVNNTASPITGSIIATYTGTFDDQSMIVASFSGCNTSAPWSSNGPYYNTVAAGSAPTVTMSAPAYSTGIVFFGTNSPVNITAPTSPWVSMQTEDNGGASYWEYLTTAYQKFTSTQTNLVVTSPTTMPTTANYGGAIIIADALVGP
jgi:hypothetical protein